MKSRPKYKLKKTRKPKAAKPILATPTCYFFDSWHVWDLNYAAIGMKERGVLSEIKKIVKCHALGSQSYYMHVDPVGDFDGCGFLMMRNCSCNHARKLDKLSFVASRISAQPISNQEATQFTSQFMRENIIKIFNVGDQATVSDGPFKALPGKVIAIEASKLVMKIDLIHSQFILSIPADKVIRK